MLAPKRFIVIIFISILEIPNSTNYNPGSSISTSSGKSKVTNDGIKDNGNKRKHPNQFQRHCEPLTIDFIASLITKEARQLLDPHLRPKYKRLRYDLYTRLNPYEPQILSDDDDNDSTLRRSYFNVSWPVRFLIHGWNGQTSTCSSAAIKEAYLVKGDYNVILVDWSDYALDINYVRVILEIFEIATKFNAFVRLLHRVYGVPFEEMYLIAHSLGCHIAGVAGKLLKPNKFGVIYALDTAGPIHRDLDSEWRLTPADAIYVESIQTNVALFGFPSDGIGHASFYPNWGLGQPHCPNVTKMEPEFLCDHFGSLYYFVESIERPQAFGAIRCNGYQSIEQLKCGCEEGVSKVCRAQVFMGGDPAIPKRGVFYLSTRKKMPFGYGGVCRVKRPLEPTAARLT